MFCSFGIEASSPKLLNGEMKNVLAFLFFSLSEIFALAFNGDTSMNQFSVEMGLTVLHPIDIQECLQSCSLGLSLQSSQLLKRVFHFIMIEIACW